MDNAIGIGFQYWVKGGFLLIPIAAVCFLIWFYFLRLNCRLKEILSTPPGLEDEIQKRLAQGQEWSRIEEFASKLSSLFYRIAAYVVEGAARGANLSALFKEVHQREFPPFERDLVVLKALVTSAPLLGLLGTVLGMIGTFQAIACKSAQTSELMASGISQALITTQFGLIVALPGIFGISLLRRKIGQLEVRFSALQIHLTLGIRKRNK